MMDVKLPNGRIVKNVPEGVTKSQLMARLEKAGIENRMSGAEALGRGAVYGTLQQPAEVVGAAFSAAMSKDLDFPTALAMARAQNLGDVIAPDEAKERSGYFGTGKFAGNMLASAPVGGAALKALSTGAKAVQGTGRAAQAARAALQGRGLSGAVTTGAAEGAATGALLEGEAGQGAAFGAIGAPIGRGIQKAGGAVLNKFRMPAQSQITQGAGNTLEELAEQIDTAPVQIDPSAEIRAADIVANAIKRDRPQDFSAVGDIMQRSGEAPIDLASPAIRSLGKGASVYPSGRQQSASFFAKAKPEMRQRLDDSISKNITSKNAYMATRDDLRQLGMAKARPFYEKAFQREVVRTPRLRKYLQQPEVKRGILQGIRLERLENPETFDIRNYFPELNKDDAAQIMAMDINEGLKLVDPILQRQIDVPDVKMNMRLLDAGKRGLDGLIAEQTSDIGRVTPLGRSLIGFRNKYMEQLREQNPDYDAALSAAGDYFKIDEAMEFGKNILRQDTEAVQKYVKGLKPMEVKALQVGIGKAYRDVLENVPDGHSVFNRLYNKKGIQEKLKAALGDAKFKQLGDDFKAEKRLFSMAQEFIGGSPTAANLSAASDFENQLGAIIDASAQRGGLIERGVDFTAQRIKNMYRGVDDEVAKEVSRMLTEPSPKGRLLLIERLKGKKALTPEQRNTIKQMYFTIDDKIQERVFRGDSVGARSGAIMGINEEQATE